jgi:hypothetical protein
LAIWAGLQSVNEIRKKDGIVDKENWGVDPNNILKGCVSYCFLHLGILLTKVAFVSIKSGCKTMHISCGIYTAPFTNNRGHSSEHWRLLACFGQE